MSYIYGKDYKELLKISVRDFELDNEISKICQCLYSVEI